MVSRFTSTNAHCETGFTADVVGRVIKGTVLDPTLTVPLLLLSQYTSKGREIAQSRAKALKTLKVLVGLGVSRWVTNWLNRRALNNWQSDKYEWNKEIAVVTGGSDGIGQRVSLLLAERGVKVAVLDIQPLKYTAPSNISYYQCDITSTEAIANAAAEIRDGIGKPTILVNNAGIATTKTILDGTERSTRLSFDINTLSHYWLAREFLPDIIAKNHGMVVTVASQASYVTTPNMVDYSATKSAAMSFHEGLASELTTRYNAPRVRTVLITQSFTKTYLARDLNTDDNFVNPLLYPDTVAEHIVRQILTGSSGEVTLPETGGLIAGNVRSLPYWFQNLLRNRLERVMRPPALR